MIKKLSFALLCALLCISQIMGKQKKSSHHAIKRTSLHTKKKKLHSTKKISSNKKITKAHKSCKQTLCKNTHNQNPSTTAQLPLPYALPGEAQAKTAQTSPDEFNRKIRVLLEESANTIEKKITLRSKDGFVLESPAGSGTTVLYQEPEIDILHQAGQLYLKCKDEKYRRIKYNTIEISSVDGKLHLNGNAYAGSLTIVSDEKNKSLLQVNKLNLEDYVFCVLSSESLPSWPLEMHKIQAVACRTYAVFCMQQALTNKHKNPYYDIGNTNAHQIYKGLHNSMHLRQAVDATHNLILTYNGQIALTMFDICCGGIVPGKLRYRDVSKPYLCRTQQCQFCKNSPSYRWKQELTSSYFLNQLKSVPSLGGYLKALGDRIVDIKITDKDQAGVVQKVKLVGTQKDVALNVRELRSILNNGHRLKSNAFTIQKCNDRLLFAGCGDGHHIGLCQWGAKNLIDQGWKLKKVLSFYYPKTTLSRLVS